MGVPGGKNQEIYALGGCPPLQSGQKSQLVQQMKEAKEPRGYHSRQMGKRWVGESEQNLRPRILAGEKQCASRTKEQSCGETWESGSDTRLRVERKCTECGIVQKTEVWENAPLKGSRTFHLEYTYPE